MSSEKNYPWLVGWYRQAIVIAIRDSKHRSLESVVETLQRTLDNTEKEMNAMEAEREARMKAQEVSRARIERT